MHPPAKSTQLIISFVNRRPNIIGMQPSKHSLATAAVRVLDEIRISPPLPSQPPQPLSFFDSLWLQSAPVERLFFYEFPNPISHFMSHTLPIFTKSLSLTLHHFYLLAGSIRPSPDSDAQFEIAYTEGDSITITVAEFIGDEFRNLSGHHPRDFEKLLLLVPKPAKSSPAGQFPPISIQITIFPNQGLCICFATNHAACDGSGSVQFIKWWAAACRSAEPTLDGMGISPPFLDRSIIIDTHGIRRKLFEVTSEFEEMRKEYLKKLGCVQVSDPSLVSATFTLGKDQIARLKERVRAKGLEEGKPLFHISAFVVTCAYVWRCLAKARGCDGDKEQYFVCAVDWRSRMRPQVPSSYFGNCVWFCMAELKSGELVGKDGIEAAAMEIGKIICGLQDTDDGDVFNAGIDDGLKLAASRPLSVAGSPKLKVYEADFGWGRPEKVEITSIMETGAISLAESRVEGGLEIGIVLPKKEMDAFETKFSSDLLDI